MAFPTYVAKGTFTTSTANPSANPPLPAGIQNGDLIIAVVSYPVTDTPTSSDTAWTRLASTATGTSATAGCIGVAVFYAIYAGSALGGFSTNNTTPLKTYQTYAFRDAKIPTISATSVQATATDTWTLPSITTTDADSFVFFAIGNDRDANSTTSVSSYTNSNLTSITELHDQTVSTGLGGGIATVYAQKATAGSTGTTSANSDGGANTAAFITFAISRSISLTADGGTYTYTGGAANLLDNKKIVADAGTFSYTGDAANTLFNRRVIADGTTFAYTGDAANLYDNKLITADSGSFAYTGEAANLVTARKITADEGTFSYSGTDAGFLYNRIVVADSGIYSYSGGDAGLIYTPVGSYTLTADAGSFSYSGTNADIKVAFLISADAGYYTYSGTDANVLVSRTIAADAGTFAYSGNDASLLSGRQITADAGSFAYTGTAANLISARKIIADEGSYTYTGTAASLNYGRKLVLDSGSFSYSGGSATLTFESGITKIWLGSGKISNLKIGSFQIYEAYLGSSQVWGRARPANAIVAETRSFTYTGSDATMFRGRKFSVNSGTYSYTGTANTLKVGRKLVADGTTYTLTGTAATLSNAYTWTRYATIYDDSGNGSSSITAVFNTNGTITFNTSLGDGASLDTDFTHWHDGGTVTGIGNSRWAKKTSSGDPTTGTLTTSLVALSSSKTISISTVGGEGRSGVELVEIYSDSGGTTKVGQITLTITATI